MAITFIPYAKYPGICVKHDGKTVGRILQDENGWRYQTIPQQGRRTGGAFGDYFPTLEACKKSLRIPVGAVDLTPSWSELVPLMVQAIRSGPAGDMLVELQRMATLADWAAAELKSRRGGGYSQEPINAETGLPHVWPDPTVDTKSPHGPD